MAAIRRTGYRTGDWCQLGFPLTPAHSRWARENVVLLLDLDATRWTCSHAAPVTPSPSGGGQGWGREDRHFRVFASGQGIEDRATSSLTPALSRWERENRVQRWVETSAPESGRAIGEPGDLDSAPDSAFRTPHSAFP